MDNDMIFILICFMYSIITILLLIFNKLIRISNDIQHSVIQNMLLINKLDRQTEKLNKLNKEVENMVKELEVFIEN